jgi:hypothetical protein
MVDLSKCPLHKVLFWYEYENKWDVSLDCGHSQEVAKQDKNEKRPPEQMRCYVEMRMNMTRIEET